ncbi:hypothetical protein ACIBRY_24210 [Streptomyces anulatus]
MDSLAALIETHFTYEGKRIVSALNALNVPGWDRTERAFLLTTEETAQFTPRPTASVSSSAVFSSGSEALLCGKGHGARGDAFRTLPAQLPVSALGIGFPLYALHVCR